MPEAKVVLVTGAAQGLGQAICRQFSESLWQVIATDLQAPPAAPNMTGLAMDVTDPPSINAAVEHIQKHFGRLDLLINNAGVIGYMPVAETDPEAVIQHFQINSFGALRVTHACLDLLAVSKGRVLNISSESSRLRTPFQIYQTTKLTLEGISDVLRRELVHLGIGVATIRPGAIETALFEEIHNINNPVADSKLSAVFDRFAAMLRNNAPTRLSTPDEVAELVFKAATDRKLRPHYQINNMFSLKLMTVLPSRWADFLIARLLR